MKIRQMELQHKENLVKQRERESKMHAEHEEVVAGLLEQMRGFSTPGQNAGTSSTTDPLPKAERKSNSVGNQNVSDSQIIR